MPVCLLTVFPQSDSHVRVSGDYLEINKYVEKALYMNSFVETTNQQSTKNDLFWWKFLRHINIFIVFPTPWKEQIPKEVLDCWLYSKKVCPKTFLFLISRKNLWNESTNLIKICVSNYISGFHQQKLPVQFNAEKAGQKTYHPI